MRRVEIIVAGASVLLAVGGAAMLTIFSEHSTAVAVVSGIAVLLGVAGLVWAFVIAPKTDDDAAVQIRELGKGVIEGNRTDSRRLYSGEKADDLTIRNNTSGPSAGSE